MSSFSPSPEDMSYDFMQFLNEREFIGQQLDVARAELREIEKAVFSPRDLSPEKLEKYRVMAYPQLSEIAEERLLLQDQLFDKFHGLSKEGTRVFKGRSVELKAVNGSPFKSHYARPLSTGKVLQGTFKEFNETRVLKNDFSIDTRLPVVGSERRSFLGSVTAEYVSCTAEVIYFDRASSLPLVAINYVR